MWLFDKVGQWAIAFAFAIVMFGICVRLAIFIIQDLHTTLMNYRDRFVDVAEEEDEDTDETGPRQKQG